ncbi:LysR substrate-binding domain-containing protein [Devosia nitrariae]|uniref:LysR substrate-binding domain-containing protein n=1 Tax=Devosia nitrariae TaxID=2071872 RepID=UPI0036D3753F
MHSFTAWLFNGRMALMDLNSLALFVRVVDSQGFSAAARATGLAKSSVSDRIAALEKEVGASLLRRNSRSFSVTELGRQVYAHARAILDEAEELDVLLKSRLAEPGGTIRISSSSTTYTSGLVEVLCGFATEFADVDFQLHASNGSVDLVDDGFDLAVRAHIQQLPDSSLIQKRLGFSPRWLVASAAYLERMTLPVVPADLAAHAGLVMSAMADAPELLLRNDAGSECRVRMSSRIAADDAQSLKAAAASGLGIAALPAGLCRTALAEGNLVRVLPDWHAGGAEISMLVPSRRGQVPSVRALALYIARHLPQAMRLTALRPLS